MTAHVLLQLLALLCLFVASLPRAVSVAWISPGWLGLFFWLLATFI